MVQQRSASVKTLEAITDAFNAHDLDAIMELKRFMGKAAV
jgi:hypothetical protein